jgi:hypothetical protein
VSIDFVEFEKAVRENERRRIIEVIRGISTGDYGQGGVGYYERTAESFQQELLEELKEGT